jgi:hypothetical protein
MRALALLALACGFLTGAELTPATKRAFDRYIELTEQRLEKTRNTQDFLYLKPTSEQRHKLRAGSVIIVPQQTRDKGKEIDPGAGLIHDWIGMLFIPRATITQVRSVLQNYDAYKDIYKPEVIDSRITAHSDDQYDIFLRLYKKQVVTVVFNTNYHVVYGQIDPAHMYVNSRSTRIAEVKDPSGSLTAEEPVGSDDGFLWALNSYWRFDEADGGVYAQLEAVSLSRDLPFGLWWLKGFIQKFPKESMEATLKGTKRALQARGR